MAGWRKGIMAGFLTLMPYIVSTGTGGSNDSLDKNSGLEEKVEFQDNFSGDEEKTGHYDESDRFLFYREDLGDEGQEIEAHIVNPNKHSISTCECKDLNNNGVYSTAEVYNSVGVSGIDASGHYSVPRGQERYFIKETFDLNVDLNKNGETFINGVESYKASLIRAGNGSLMHLRSPYDDKSSDFMDRYLTVVGRKHSAYSMDSRKDAVESMGKIGANKARYLAGACQDLSEGNKEPIKDFLRGEASSEVNFYFSYSSESGWRTKEINVDVLSDKVWEGIHSPGVALGDFIKAKEE